MYYGGAAPDNQDYSPYNTPDANTAAEGKTGGGVTHKTFESSLLTNVLGSQGTSDRSQWRYYQPVYCKTYTETRRSEAPGLMSTPLRAVYRGGSTSYNYNYGGELLANRGGFELLPPDDQTLGCPFPVGCPSSTGITNTLTPGDVLVITSLCSFFKIEWFNTDQVLKIGEGTTYIVQSSDIGTKIYFLITYDDNSIDQSNLNCFNTVQVTINLNFFYLHSVGGPFSGDPSNLGTYPAFDVFGNYYVLSWWATGSGSSPLPKPYKPVVCAVNKNRELLWSYDYNISDGYPQSDSSRSALCFDGTDIHCFTFKRDSVNFNKMYMQNLVLDATTGAIKKIKGIEYFVSVLDQESEIHAVTQVETDGSGNFWLAFRAPENYVVSPLLTTNTSVIALIQTSNNDSLTTVWTYEVIQKLTTDPIRFTGTSTDGFRLDLEQDLIYFQGRPQSSFARPTLVVLQASTGQVLYRQPFATVNSSPTILGYRTNYIDNEGNLYQVANNSTGASTMDAGTDMWISKKNVTKNIVWMKNYQSVLTSNHTCSTNALLVIKDKLIFLLSRNTGFPLVRTPVMLIMDTETGELNRNVRITVSPSSNYGTDMKIVKGLRPDEFIIISSYGYCLTLNINNVPFNTTITTTNTLEVYTFADFTTSGVQDYTSYAETTLPLAPDRAWPAVGTFYTLPAASGIPESLASPVRISGVSLTI